MVETTSELQKFLSTQFRFDADLSEKLIELTPPCKALLEQYDTVMMTAGGAEAAVVASLEAAANRFLRSNLKPNSKVSQKATLEAIERHSQALISLLTSSAIDGSIADPFRNQIRNELT
ncbi:hypothetical protein QEO92_06910 [Neorhizobium petrolearium]|uniref:Uncharacterized protein n=1 Tax=Neorhizobium petrolearium TaxID=515361 RepID=A0ABY8M808_9HYPH|nr:hypothetical protein [Neorhizobium petrolearium]WGI69784.1 hypothetical protein QEO92_06910 [Neorhizobium petrolearium]